MAQRCFNQRSPWVLSAEELEKLTVTDTGLQISQDTVMVKIENGRVMGSRWGMTGNLRVLCLAGMVFLDLENLSQWIFARSNDPREVVNLSIWRKEVSRVKTIICNYGPKCYSKE